MNRFGAMLAVGVLAAGTALAAVDPAAEALRIYLDCTFCDREFIKTELAYVNYVIDRAVADVHVLVTTETTASGGTEYTLAFVGQRRYAGLSDTLRCATSRFDSEDTIRRGLVRTLALGLVRYLARTPVAESLAVVYAAPSAPRAPVDRWRNWVFRINLNGFADAQQRRQLYQLYGSLDADWITADWKALLECYASTYRTYFQLSDTLTVASATQSQGFYGEVVRSLGEHWSAGGEANVYTSTYSNMRFATQCAPAVEFSIYPYAQSTSRRLVARYRTSYSFNRYFEETIYDRFHDNLFGEALAVGYETKQRWGTVDVSLEGRHYFHDFSKNRLTLGGELSLQVVRGLSVRIYSQAALVHDQLSISKRNLTPEEILLQQKQLATQYQYYVSLGLTYAFGSVYSNIVNPRFRD